MPLIWNPPTPPCHKSNLQTDCKTTYLSYIPPSPAAARHNMRAAAVVAGTGREALGKAGGFSTCVPALERI